jgi:hypothetical protein
MNFVVSFSQAKHGSTCSDFLEIFDGDSETGVSLGKYCGKTIPQVENSQTNSIHIFFTSDSRNQGLGFALSWVTAGFWYKLIDVVKIIININS